MYAIVEHNNQQFKIKPEMELTVDRMALEIGAQFAVDRVLMLSDSDNTRMCLGQPTVGGASVQFEVVEHFRDKKVLVTKFKRRKNYLKRQGHRQDKTTLKVIAIDTAQVNWD